MSYIEASINVLREEIRKARKRPKAYSGVNIMVALTNFADMVETSISRRCRPHHVPGRGSRLTSPST